MNREAYEPRYNAQPGATLPVVRAGDPARGETAPRVVESMRWGLVPSFTPPDERPDHFRMFNARSETLAEKPAFGRLLARKRAVVLLSGFYEWRDEGGRGRDAVKQPYYLHLSDDAPRPLRCAALYDVWRRANEPEPVTTVTIVTVPASGPIEWLHDRMPAVLASDEVMLTIRPGEHGSTYGGNPLGCAVAIAALEVLRDERLAENSAAMGEILRRRLAAIDSPAIAEVRGRGLLNAVVVRPDGEGRDASALCDALMHAGLLTKTTKEHIIRLAPPLVITEAEVDEAADIFEAQVRAVFG